MKLIAGDLEATVMPELGMVISSLTHRGEELLAQRGGPEAYATKGSSFAIPFLHPWANRLLGWEYTFDGQTVEIDRDSPALHIDGDTGFAIHGVLGASPYWTVTAADDRSLVAELDFAAVPEYMAVFPFPHRLRFSAELVVSALTVALTVVSTGESPVPIAFGFHPYLTLPGSDRSTWQLKLPVADGSLDGPLGDRSFDRPFTRLNGHTFTVSDASRRLTVTFDQGYDVTQVFSPPGAQFICFEPMTAPVDALRTGEGLRSVAPGETFTGEFTITVEGSS